MSTSATRILPLHTIVINIHKAARCSTSTLATRVLPLHTVVTNIHKATRYSTSTLATRLPALKVAITKVHKAGKCSTSISATRLPAVKVVVTNIHKSSIYTKLRNVSNAILYCGECNNWQSAFKKKNSTDEVDITVRQIMSNFNSLNSS
ncbi:hypothetical protein RchiOBHm_Chr1g0361621 [Rosa chinensis]|uniref:Uncharacterized protein n=1 Tax=Rosa chinensis TaxID=74649 RepID=A0A2P6SIZ6_ROSCH|nr:hypothetical protein RchiOBHm_Chr1g0361621 [Rosa chinensis]